MRDTTGLMRHAKGTRGNGKQFLPKDSIDNLRERINELTVQCNRIFDERERIHTVNAILLEAAKNAVEAIRVDEETLLDSARMDLQEAIAKAEER